MGSGANGCECVGEVCIGGNWSKGVIVSVEVEKVGTSCAKASTVLVSIPHQYYPKMMISVMSVDVRKTRTDQHQGRIRDGSNLI